MCSDVTGFKLTNGKQKKTEYLHRIMMGIAERYAVGGTTNYI